MLVFQQSIEHAFHLFAQVVHQSNMLGASQRPGAFQWAGEEGSQLVQRRLRQRGVDYLTHESVLATAG